MSASTATVSPRTRLTGNRPHSSSGFTPRMTTRSGGRSLIFRAYHGPLTPLVVAPIVRVAVKLDTMPLSFPNESASAFLRARDLLAQHRTDYTTAVKEFRWPELAHFNWALDYFDTYADGNESEALEIVEEDGRQCIMSFAAVSARSNQVANFLRECGVRRGDCILLMLGNEIALWETLLAAMKLGAVITPATPLLRRGAWWNEMPRGQWGTFVP